jgi:hypothetical protein
MSKILLRAVIAVRTRCGSPSSDDVAFALVNPVLTWLDDAGVPQYSKTAGGWPSGNASTTEVDFIVLLLCLSRYLVSIGQSLSDCFVTGVGDDVHLVTPYLLDLDDVKASFLEMGIKIKCWAVGCVEEFDFLGASMVTTRDGPQPVWNLERSIVHLTYSPKKETDFVHIMRVIGVLAYNVHHSQVGVLREYLRHRVGVSVMTSPEKVVVLKALYDVKKHYVARQYSLGGSKE